MAKKKELDNLSLDMIRCKADGFGFHYGHWKTLHKETKVKEEETIPEGWLICQYCGKAFKLKTRRHQKYCELACQQEAAHQRRDKEKYAEYYRNHIAKKREQERKLRNESYA